MGPKTLVINSHAFTTNALVAASLICLHPDFEGVEKVEKCERTEMGGEGCCREIKVYEGDSKGEPKGVISGGGIESLGSEWDEKKAKMASSLLVEKVWSDYGVTISKNLSFLEGLRNLRHATIERVLADFRNRVIKPISYGTAGFQFCDCNDSLFTNVLSPSGIISRAQFLATGAENYEGPKMLRKLVLDYLVPELRRILVNKLEEYDASVQILDESFDLWNKQRTANPQSSASILELSHFIPAADLIYDYEDAGTVPAGVVKWLLFQDDRNLQYRIKAIAERHQRFQNRALIHPDLRGLRGKELVDAMRYQPDSQTEPNPDYNSCFAHHSGFTGGGFSKRFILALVEYDGKA